MGFDWTRGMGCRIGRAQRLDLTMNRYPVSPFSYKLPSCFDAIKKSTRRFVPTVRKAVPGGPPQPQARMVASQSLDQLGKIMRPTITRDVRRNCFLVPGIHPFATVNFKGQSHDSAARIREHVIRQQRIKEKSVLMQAQDPRKRKSVAPHD